MKRVVLVILFMAACLEASAGEYIYARDFGAKGDGKTNDTEAIQRAIRKAQAQKGGTVMLSSGVFIVDSLVLGPKTSIIGVGQGATIIRKTPRSKGHCIIIAENAAGLKIADLTINGLGSTKGSGIYSRITQPSQGENHNYIWESFREWDKRQSYKWIQINNISICNFDVGLNIEKWGFDINISECSFSRNGDGVIFNCTDSAIHNCYINNNSRNGLVVGGSNNRISGIKSIFNGAENAPKYSAVHVKGMRNMIVNVETQDNFCKAFDVDGMYNMFSNCLSNTDGYTSKPYHYDPATNACGFIIRKKFNSFCNCIVTNYNKKYGAIYKTPVIVEPEVCEWYPDILKDIRVILGRNQVMFNEVEESELKVAGNCEVFRANLIDEQSGERYFKVESGSRSYIAHRKDYDISHLNVLADYKMFSSMPKSADIWTIGEGASSLSLKILNDDSGCRYSLASGVKELISLNIEDPELLVKRNQRVIVSFDSQGLQIVSYMKTLALGWVKKENVIPIDNIDFKAIQSIHNTISFSSSDAGMGLRHIVMSYRKIQDDVYLPGSTLINLRNDAFVYLDADLYRTEVFKAVGSKYERPKLGIFDAGYQYFDTTAGRPIWWDGKKWVKSDGNEA